MPRGVSTTTEESLTRTDAPLLRRKAFSDNFASQNGFLYYSENMAAVGSAVYRETQIKRVISGLRSGVNEIFALLGRYTA